MYTALEITTLETLQRNLCIEELLTRRSQLDCQLQFAKLLLESSSLMRSKACSRRRTDRALRISKCSVRICIDAPFSMRMSVGVQNGRDGQ